MGILSKVSQREKLGALPEELALRLAQASERNLRRALLMLEACHVQQGKWTEDQEVRGCCWGWGRGVVGDCGRRRTRIRITVTYTPK